MNRDSPPPRAPYSPCPSLPPHTHPSGREGRPKNKLEAVSLLSRQGGREAGEEGRGGEGPDGAGDRRLKKVFESGRARDIDAPAAP